ncbi:MAG: DUF1003 domain-containing protein [Casimicrobiaceae bacterium]
MEPTIATPDPITQNIETIAAFCKREEEKITWSQEIVEAASGIVARPAFVGCIILFVTLWVLADIFARRLGITQFDPPPFFWLEGVVGLGALLATTVVLIRQERLAKIEERRAHLDLQVILLTEQKTTKPNNLIEELRRDLPMIANRHDPEAEAMQRSTDPHRVLAETDEANVTPEPKRDARTM